jgi:hypothetical protein
VSAQKARKAATSDQATTLHETRETGLEANPTAITSPEIANGLTKYDAARRALAAAHRIDEVKTIHDKALALRVYALQARDRVLVDQATEIRLRAERRAGELLREMADRGERAVRKNMKSQPATSTLSDLGINKSQSSRWQKLAAIADDAFEDVVDRAKQGASAALDRAQQQPRPKSKPKPKPKRDAADVVAACVAELEAVVRAAVSRLDSEGRLGLFDQIETAIRAIKAQAAAQDDDVGNVHGPDPEAAAARWRETQ